MASSAIPITSTVRLKTILDNQLINIDTLITPTVESADHFILVSISRWGASAGTIMTARSLFTSSTGCTLQFGSDSIKLVGNDSNGFKIVRNSGSYPSFYVTIAEFIP